MYALIIIFMILSLIIGLFSTAFVTREVVIEEKQRRKSKQAPIEAAVKAETTAETSAEARVEACAAAAEEKAPLVAEPLDLAEPSEQSAPSYLAASLEAATIAQAGEGAVTEGAVTFSTMSQTLDEKYLELSPEQKGYYDEIVRYAMAVNNSKRYKNSSYEEYKVGKSRIVRLKIRRGVIVCEFVIPNLTFKNYISDNKVAVKQAPAVIKVADESSLSAVKDSIEIAVKAIEEEKAYKKEQAKLRRRAQRRAAKETA